MNKSLKPRPVLDPKNFISIKISKILFLIVLILSSMHFFCLVLPHFGFENHNIYKVLTKLFYLDAERTVPAWFSTCILWSSGIGLFAIGSMEKKSISRFWFLIGSSIIYVSLDENIGLHEHAMKVVNSLAEKNDIALPDFLAFSWVIPACIAVLVLFLVLIPFFTKLESQMRKLLFIAAFVFLSGAVGMEMFGAYAAINLHGNWYLLASTIEEILEMCGVIILLHAVTSQLFLQFKKFSKTA